MPEFPFFSFKVTLEGDDAELFPNHKFLKPVMHRIENIYHFDPDRLYPDREYPRNVSKPCLMQHPTVLQVSAVVQFIRDGAESIIAEVWVTTPWNYENNPSRINDQKIHVANLSTTLWQSEKPHIIADEILKLALNKVRGKQKLAMCEGA